MMIATETTEALQQEIDEAKSRLSAKIETLEQQYNVVENAQQAGAAVAATVEAVQATAQVVNGAVESLHSAVDLQSHIRKHPWLCIGGSAALGYLLAKCWPDSQTRVAPSFVPQTDARPAMVEPLTQSTASSVAGSTPSVNGAFHESPTDIASRAYHQAMLQTSPAYNLKILAMNTLMGVVRETAARAVPRIADLLLSNLNQAQSDNNGSAR